MSGRGARPSDGRGRSARTPAEIPAPGWKDTLLRVKRQIGRDHITFVGAGVAFYGFLALFPTLVALFSLYGLAAEPSDVSRQLSGFARALPPEAAKLLEEQMQRLAAGGETGLGWGAVIGFLAALWSSSKAVKGMMLALNIAYGEEESRGFIKESLMGLWLTFLIVVAVTTALAFIIVAPPLLDRLALGEAAQRVVGAVRWPILLALAFLIIGLLYRLGPNRADARFSWLSPGAIFAAVSWMLASWGFSFFVSRFGNYGETYGSLAAVIILLLWFMLSATLVLIGAELNAELERQTRRDSTTGAERPLGARGAYAADTVAGDGEAS